jgi:acetyl esterase/lipase
MPMAARTSAPLLALALGFAAFPPLDDPSQREILTGDRFEVRLERGIEFARRGELELRLDLFLPDGPPPHPVAIVIHGGGWSLGARNLGEAAALSAALAREGVAAVSIDHRLAPRDPFPAQLEDCRDAFEFLVENAERWQLDPDRIALVGASSGGHLAALLATTGAHASGSSEGDATEGEIERPGRSSPAKSEPAPAAVPPAPKPRCVVAFSAPMQLGLVPDSPPTRPQLEIVGRFLGVDPDLPREQRLRLLLERGPAASPSEFVDASDPPMLLVHGGRDPLVPMIQSQLMADALAEAGVEHELLILPRASHCEYLIGSRGFLDDAPEWWQRVRAFLRAHLRSEAASTSEPR